MTDYSYSFILLYSLVQGITEFIPVSSSGHLNIIESLYNDRQSRNLLYETTAHFSSLLALITYLYKNNSDSLKDLFSNNFKLVVVSMIPALAMGLIIKILNLNFLSLHMIAYTSIIGAVMLLLVIKFKKIRIKTRSLKLDFFIAGLFQCLAFLPGFSRSGSCITAFVLLDKKRELAIKNSLLMSFPIILISFLSNAKELNLISLDINLLIIFIITFISAYLTLLFFIKYINRIGFMPYVIYRILLGSILLIYFS